MGILFYPSRSAPIRDFLAVGLTSPERGFQSDQGGVPSGAALTNNRAGSPDGPAYLILTKHPVKSIVNRVH